VLIGSSKTLIHRERSRRYRMQELLEKCHPLGMFDSIATLAVAANMRELYRLVLVDTPLAPYFAETLSSEDLDEMNIEILRNTLYKVRGRPIRQFLLAGIRFWYKQSEMRGMWLLCVAHRTRYGECGCNLGKVLSRPNF
jgi:hypothetical protein